MSKMKQRSIPRSKIVLSVLYCAVCAEAMGSGGGLMSNDIIEMISLNASQYCLVDDNTLRVNLSTTTLLSIIDSSEGVIMAKAIGNNNVIFTALLNGSRCMDNNEDDQFITTLYIIQMTIYSISILFAIANITLHLVVKDLRTTSGILMIILSISVILVISLAMGSRTNIYASNITVVCVVLMSSLYELSFVYQATKLSILYHFAYLMYLSYKLKGNHKEKIKKRVLKYIIFIIGSSLTCFLLALAIDVGVNGRIFSDMERYCQREYEYTFLFVTVVYGEYAVFIILQCITFAAGLTLYFLVSKKCTMKSTNFRVTMVLVTTVGVNIVLLIILSIAEVSFDILVPAVTSVTLAEQLILLALVLSSKKAHLAYKTACIKDTRPPNNQQQV